MKKAHLIKPVWQRFCQLNNNLKEKLLSYFSSPPFFYVVDKMNLVEKFQMNLFIRFHCVQDKNM